MIGKVEHKAVLVYPRFDTQDTFWSYERSLKMYSPPGEFGQPKRLLPPLGLMGLYRHLKSHYDQIILIDQNVDPKPLQELIVDADHVYIGGMLTQENEFLKASKIVKKAGKVLIAGGPIVARDSPLMDIADHLIENEAEMVIDDLLLGLIQGNARKYYQGIFAPPEKFFKPDYASVKMQNYVHMAVQISRGCPEACEFCDAPARFGKSYRVTPHEDTLASFRQMAELGWNGPVFIVDDNFIGNPKIALEVLKNLYRIGEEIGVHHPKYTELTLRLADHQPIMHELSQWFRKTNFISGFYGVETPNKASLQETDKRQNLRGERSLVQKLRYISEQTGAGVMMGMIYGFDNDTQDTVDEIIEFVNATHVPIVMAGLLNALPFTGLLERMKREGRYFRSSSRNNSDGVINFIPQNFSVQQAEKNYLTILEEIYKPDAYFTRVMRHLQLVEAKLQVQVDYRSTREKIHLLTRILFRQNATIYWRHLPAAHRIAKKRFGFNTTGYLHVISEYFALCGQYTHFKGQISILREKISVKKYEPWQQFSWTELQCSLVDKVEQLEPGQTTNLFEKINVRLKIDHEITGTRLDALSYFVEPYLQEGMRGLENDTLPTLDQLIDVEVKAYRMAHQQRPEILGRLDFALIERHLRETLPLQKNYLQRMRKLYRKTQAIANFV